MTGENMDTPSSVLQELEHAAVLGAMPVVRPPVLALLTDLHVADRATVLHVHSDESCEAEPEHPKTADAGTDGATAAFTTIVNPQASTSMDFAVLETDAQVVATIASSSPATAAYAAALQDADAHVVSECCVCADFQPSSPATDIFSDACQGHHVPVDHAGTHSAGPQGQYSLDCYPIDSSMCCVSDAWTHTVCPATATEVQIFIRYSGPVRSTVHESFPSPQDLLDGPTFGMSEANVAAIAAETLAFSWTTEVAAAEIRPLRRPVDVAQNFIRVVVLQFCTASFRDSGHMSRIRPWTTTGLLTPHTTCGVDPDASGPHGEKAVASPAISFDAGHSKHKNITIIVTLQVFAATSVQGPDIDIGHHPDDGNTGLLWVYTPCMISFTQGK